MKTWKVLENRENQTNKQENKQTNKKCRDKTIYENKTNQPTKKLKNWDTIKYSLFAEVCMEFNFMSFN